MKLARRRRKKPGFPIVMRGSQWLRLSLVYQWLKSQDLTTTAMDDAFLSIPPIEFPESFQLGGPNWRENHKRAHAVLGSRPRQHRIRGEHVAGMIELLWAAGSLGLGATGSSQYIFGYWADRLNKLNPLDLLADIDKE